MNTTVLLSLCLFGAAGLVAAQDPFEKDVVPTAAGDLGITFIGHGTLMFRFGGKVIHVDPYGKLTDYAKLPAADVILITHDHVDHLDPTAVGRIRTGTTVIVMPEACARKLPGGTVMTNGETRIVQGLTIRAVPAYNLVHTRDNGQPFHPKGAGNGYVIAFGDKHVYVAGDTENTPEMRALTGIDIAFLPMNLPYTMTPAMVADAAKAFRPKVLYPYHYGDTDVTTLTDLLKDTPEIEVRIRRMR